MRDSCLCQRKSMAAAPDSRVVLEEGVQVGDDGGHRAVRVVPRQRAPQHRAGVLAQIFAEHRGQLWK